MPPASARRIVSALWLTCGVPLCVTAAVEEPPLQPALHSARSSSAASATAVRNGVCVLIAATFPSFLPCAAWRGSIRMWAAHRTVDSSAELSLVHPKRGSLLYRSIRRRRIAHESVRLREQCPAIRVVRLGSEPLLEAADERRDRCRLHRRGAVGGRCGIGRPRATRRRSIRGGPCDARQRGDSGRNSRIAWSIEVHFHADSDDPSDEHERAKPALQLEPALLPKPQRDGDEYCGDTVHSDQHARSPRAQAAASRRDAALYRVVRKVRKCADTVHRALKPYVCTFSPRVATSTSRRLWQTCERWALAQVPSRLRSAEHEAASELRTASRWTSRPSISRSGRLPSS